MKQYSSPLVFFSLVLNFIVVQAFLFPCSVTGQPYPSIKLTEDELLKGGQRFYDAEKFTKASIYWYAYLQRKPIELNDQEFRSNFMSCLDYSLQKSESQGLGLGSAGVKGKSDDANAKDKVYNKKPALGKPPSATSSIQIQSIGSWSCNDSGTYYIRQSGKEIWWYGESKDSGASWTSVMHGVIVGDTISGQWTDIPKGKTSRKGQITLRIDGVKKLSLVKSTGGLIGDKWNANNVVEKNVINK